MTTTPTFWRTPQRVSVSALDSGDLQIIGLANGNILVVWTEGSDAVAEGTGTDIVGIVYDALGNVLVPAQQLNSFGSSRNEADPVIAADGEGGFLLVYETPDQGAGTDILYERFDATLVNVDNGYIVNGVTGDAILRDPTVTHLGEGAFRVAYELQVNDDQSIFYRDLSASGVTSVTYPVAFDDNLAGGTDNSNPLDPDSAILANGTTVTVFRENTQLSADQVDPGIRVFVSSDSSTSGRSVTSIGNGRTETDPQVAALAGGGFVVVWTVGSDVWGRIFGSNALPATPEFLIASGTDLQNEPDVIGLEDGGFFVVWDNDTAATLEGLRFSGEGADFGVPIGEALTIARDTDGAGSITRPALGLTEDGRILVGWDNSGDAWTAILDPRDYAITVDPEDTVTTGRQDGSHITGSALGDRIVGGAGADIIDGNGGNDILTGGNGHDRLAGGAGNDVLDGGSGDDRASYTLATAGVRVRLDVAGAQNTLGDGIDMLFGIEGVEGSQFADILRGNSGANSLFGNDGNDTLRGGDGQDGLRGGAGDDIVRGETGGDVLQGGDGNDRLDGGDGFDTLYGDAGDDVLTGGALNDFLIGGAGRDSLNGGEGIDSMVGGVGDDIYYVENIDDSVDEGLDQGADRVFSTISYTLPPDVEILNLTGGSIDGTGNALANMIYGSSGLNVLSGLDGADNLFGGRGADTLLGGNGDDRLIGDIGRDTLTGGAGADRFRYLALDHSDPVANRADTITDFARAEGDRIDLAQIDAIAGTAADDRFTFIGSAAFTTGVAGQLRAFASAGETIVEIDVNGDALADMAIRITGTVTLAAGDFIL